MYSVHRGFHSFHLIEYAPAFKTTWSLSNVFSLCTALGTLLVFTTQLYCIHVYACKYVGST